MESGLSSKARYLAVEHKIKKLIRKLEFDWIDNGTPRLNRFRNEDEVVKKILSAFGMNKSKNW